MPAAIRGLSHQMLRTYNDGLWTCEKPPPPFVLALLGTAVDPIELAAAVSASLLSRPGPPLTFGQQVVLEAIRGFDELLLAAAPHIPELLRDEPPLARH